MADDEEYRKKAEKGEESEKSVVAIDESVHFVQKAPASTTSDNPFSKKWNDKILYYVCSENMDDELYPIGKCLFETVPAAAFYWAIRAGNGPGEYWVHTTEPGYYQLRLSDEVCGAMWSTDTINMWTVGKVRVRIEDGEWYMDWLFKYNDDGIQVDCDTDGNILDESGTFVRRDTFEGFPRLWYASYDDVMFIINRIPKCDHHYFYHGSQFKDTPWVVYRNAILVKNRGKEQPIDTTGGAFIDVYYQQGVSADEAGILIGASPCARGKGYTDQLVKKAIAETPDIIKTFTWKCAKENKHSLNLALRCGFVLDEEKSRKSKTDNYLRYERYHSNLNETPMASTLDDDFKEGKKLSLSSFKRMELTERLRKKYSDEYPMLRHFYSSDNFHLSYIWLDGKKVVAGLCVSKPDDKFPGQTWITSLEITKDYRGHGLSKQLLDFACRKCNADALGVAEDNEIARHLYEKYGFKYGDDVGKPNKNGTNFLMYLSESSGATTTLYHGSPNKHATLRAQVSPAYPDQAAVFATPRYEFALAFAGNSWSDLQINQCIHDGVHTLTEILPGQFNRCFNCPGYIHYLKPDEFAPFGRASEWTSPVDAKPYKIERISNVLRALEKSGTILYHYPNLPEWIPDRKEYMAKIIEKYNMGTTVDRLYKMHKMNESDVVLHEMAYEDAQDFMLAKLKHYCREFNRRDNEFERIKQSWKKENSDCGDPPKLEVALHHGNENQILFIMVPDMDTDHYSANQVASYWHLVKHLTDEVKKDEDVQNYSLISDISCEAEDIVGVYVNLNHGLQESVVETHPMDRDEKKSVADKYGLKAVGQTHDEADRDAAIEKQKELDRKKKERLKHLEKGRRTQKRNRVIKKIKSHLPGVKNEDTAVDGSAAEYLTDPNANVELDLFNRRVKPMHKGAGDNDFDDSIHESASYQFSMMDNVQFFDGLAESVGEDAEFAPVYVVLIRGNSPVSALITGFTGSEFTHASISFDSSLTEMYSFAGKNARNTLEAIIGGFKRENIQDRFYKENDIPYAVYLVASTKGAVKRMKKRLNYFIKNETNFRFDYLGLVKNFFKIPDDPKYTWFCSRFVADILNAGTPGERLINTPSLYRPEDFKTANFAQLVDRGMAANYTSRNVDRQTKIIAKAMKVRDAKLHEGAMYPDNPYSHQVLQYQFAMMDEGAVDGFIKYLQSFKIRLDGDGNILITRREYDQLDSHFRDSMRLIKACETAGNVQGVKDELCKINYMITLINQYYLRDDVKNLKPTAKDIRKDMLDLRSVMMNVFRQHLTWVTTQDPRWNFQRYYDNSKYGKNVAIPKKVITSVGRTIITALA